MDPLKAYNSAFNNIYILTIYMRNMTLIMYLPYYARIA